MKIRLLGEYAKGQCDFCEAIADGGIENNGRDYEVMEGPNVIVGQEFSICYACDTLALIDYYVKHQTPVEHACTWICQATYKCGHEEGNRCDGEHEGTPSRVNHVCSEHRST